VAGLVPVVPAQPPALLPGPTARQMFHRFLRRSAAGVLAVVILFQIGLSGVWFWLLPLSGLALFLLMANWWSHIGTRNFEELHHGYTTFTMLVGAFKQGSLRTWQGHHHRAPWDYRGTWVLDQHGRVLSPPDRSVEPPGFYPSPDKPGALELWTGVVWLGHYRNPNPGS
jgi:hypothetical protein